MPAKPCAIWAVVPVNHLSHAKSRLAAALGEHRAAFAKSLMLHTLDTLRESGVFDGYLVVTPDEFVAALATANGAESVTDHGTSLNEACALGLAAAQARGADLTVFLHADLALLRADDIRSLLAAYRAACANEKPPRLGLVRCKDGDGTNIVFRGRDTPFMPHFGPRSFARHAADPSFCELFNENAAFDIDTVADLAQLLDRLDVLDPSDPIARMLRDEQVRQDML